MANEEKVDNEVTKMEQENVSSNNQQIINTEAAKAKASEVASKAKAGVGNFTAKFKSDKKFQTTVIGVAIIAVLVIIVLIAYLTGGSKGAVKGFAKAYVEMDAKKVVEYFNEDYLDYYSDYMDVEDNLDDLFDNYKDEDYIFKSYEITDSEKFEKDDIEDLAERLDESFDIREDDVTDAVVYTIKFKIDDDGDKETEKMDVTAVKIDGKWYIFTGDLLE